MNHTGQLVHSHQTKHKKHFKDKSMYLHLSHETHQLYFFQTEICILQVLYCIFFIELNQSCQKSDLWCDENVYGENVISPNNAH